MTLRITTCVTSVRYQESLRAHDGCVFTDPLWTQWTGGVGGRHMCMAPKFSVGTRGQRWIVSNGNPHYDRKNIANEFETPLKESLADSLPWQRESRRRRKTVNRLSRTGEESWQFDSPAATNRAAEEMEIDLRRPPSCLQRAPSGPRGGGGEGGSPPSPQQPLRAALPSLPSPSPNKPGKRFASVD